MKIRYSGSNRVDSIWEVLSKVFSITYYDWDETPKAISLIILGKEWQWLVGNWEDEEYEEWESLKKRLEADDL